MREVPIGKLSRSVFELVGLELTLDYEEFTKKTDTSRLHLGGLCPTENLPPSLMLV